MHLLLNLTHMHEKNIKNKKGDEKKAATHIVCSK